jgi:hypothetical protein
MDLVGRCPTSGVSVAKFQVSFPQFKYLSRNYCCCRLAGGTIPFIRKYTTIWP